MKNHFYLFFLISVLLFSGCGGGSQSSSGNDNSQIQDNNDNNSGNTTSSSRCSALPEPTGSIITVVPGDVDQLSSIVGSVTEGTTVLLQDGTYNLNGGSLRFNTPNVTLRSASGNPEAVILDGNYQTNQIITVAASNVTIAEITVQKAYTHPIHVISSSQNGDTLNTLIYRVHVIDPREQAIKINPHQAGSKVDNGEISCSRVVLTDAGRPNISGCYTGGIDAHQARDWVVRDNYFAGFWCNSGLSQHAIHFWTGSRGTLVERNVLVDNARGIGFGLLSNRPEVRTYSDGVCPESAGLYIGHYEGIIRNNFISAANPAFFNSDVGFDCGLCIASACRANVVHNTIMSNDSSFASIDIRYSGTNNSKILNNLMSHSIRIRNGAIDNDIRFNLEDIATDVVVNISEADLHLNVSNAVQAIDNGILLDVGTADSDIDEDSRDNSPDIGADEI